MNRTPKNAVHSIIGLGDASLDGHTRLTEGENFKVYDGSEEGHALIQKLCIKINQELDQRGQRLEHLSRTEFLQLLKDIGATE